MPLKAYFLSPKRELRIGLSEQEVKTSFESRQGLLWVDIEGATAKDSEFLENVFHFHPLAIEDCLSTSIHPPKVDDFGEHLFIIIHGVNYTVESEIVNTAELAIFMGTHFVVSNHDYPLYNVTSIQHLVEENGRFMERGADFLSYALIDSLIDNVLPTIDEMGDRSEEIEEEILRNPQQTTLDTVLKLKRSTLRLHRVMAPQREILNRLSRGDFPLVRQEARIFYRDIYDHLVRIEDLNQTLRERASDALAMYLSSVANRQNETMKVLSLVATIFLPLSLLAGIYGMNFDYMPELKVPWAYFAVLGVMASAVAVIIWRFWVHKWFSWGRRQVVRVRPFKVETEKLVRYIGHIAKIPRLQ